MYAISFEKRRRIRQVWASGGTGKAYPTSELLEHIARTFGNAQPRATAQDQLRNLVQADGQPFGEFLPIFEDIMSTASANQWNNDAQLTWLRNVLSPTLRDELVASNMPTDYSDYLQDTPCTICPTRRYLHAR
ncbi:hypothetical protein jhhlp_006383 [Lomentospora prolificans]|uniref:Retrotransposon gag domain-containing protein n=1 Tax=Lomentospora prolificans TaxID=41688 RepID=A0A2N3N5R9_9PEZI|nr:hypothetical protein jhhlp_006383 [Lomentospora prolificans]